MTTTLYKRVFCEAKVQHQSSHDPLTHAVYDLEAIKGTGHSADLRRAAQTNRQRQERRLHSIAFHNGGDVHDVYSRQPHQDHALHATQVARIMTSRSGATAHSYPNGVEFKGHEQDRAKHAHDFADAMNRLHGDGVASVSAHKTAHRVGLNLPEHSDREARAVAQAHQGRITEAKKRLVRTGGEHLQTRTKPLTLGEHMFMHSVNLGKSSSRKILDKSKKPIVFDNPEFPAEWQGAHKSYSTLKTAEGAQVVVHFWEHPKTKKRYGAKFKAPGT